MLYRVPYLRDVPTSKLRNRYVQSKCGGSYPGFDLNLNMGRRSSLRLVSEPGLVVATGSAERSVMSRPEIPVVRVPLRRC
jgi:hypothetical protein